jgi:NADPH:quinone reductase-like Zn-dependent oxidoreductase
LASSVADATKRTLDILDLKRGETLLVHGAAGSGGTIVVRVAKARGAAVIATANEANQDYVRSLGAIPTVYGDGLVDRVRALAPRVDAVLDIAGKGALEDSITLRHGTDRIVSIGDPGAPKLGVTYTATNPQMRSSSQLEELAELAARGELIPLVSGSFPLDRAAAAQLRPNPATVVEKSSSPSDPEAT